MDTPASNAEILAELNPVKCLFQLRAISAAIGIPPYIADEDPISAVVGGGVHHDDGLSRRGAAASSGNISEVFP